MNSDPPVTNASNPDSLEEVIRRHRVNFQNTNPDSLAEAIHTNQLNYKHDDELLFALKSLGLDRQLSTSGANDPPKIQLPQEIQTPLELAVRQTILKNNKDIEQEMAKLMQTKKNP